MKLELHLTLLTDATFGRGDGVAGLIDAEVEHDKYGMPYLRGRTLKGLLVEECANILYSLQQSSPLILKRFEDAAFFLFGRAGSALDADAQMRVGDAKLPSALRAAIVAATQINEKIDRHDAVTQQEKLQALTPEQVLNALTTIRRQTAVDDETSAPEENSLRSLRVALNGTEFHSELRFINEPAAEDANAVYGLLAACVMALRRAGTSRNRGRGKLEAKLYKREDAALSPVTADFFNLFEASLKIKPEVNVSGDEVADDGSDANAKDSPSQSEKEETTSTKGKSRVITYRVHLLEPLLVTELDGDPNSAIAFNYIPGSVVRGACIAKFQRRFHSPDLADDSAGRRLFFDGAVRFLNAYPIANKKRSLPTPLSLQYERNNEEEIYDFSVGMPEEDPNDKQQWKRVAKPFCSLNDEAVLIEPERRLAIHTARTRRFGRAMSVSIDEAKYGDIRGAVYRYESLAAEQEFAGAILCEESVSDEDVSRLLNYLNGETSLGGSRSGGYGRVEFADVKLKKATLRETEFVFNENDDDEIADKENDDEGDESFYESGDEVETATLSSCELKVTLLSDVLLRDENGQFAGSIDAVGKVLQNRLRGTLTPRQSFASIRPTGGFNRKWGLPLAQAQSIRMGSVFVFDAQSCNLSKLPAIEWSGIGERRVEGFGRVAFDLHNTERFQKIDPHKELNPIVNSLIGSDDERIAMQMANRLLRLRLDELVIQESMKIKIPEAKNAPSNSQIGRLRNIIHEKLMSDPPSPTGVKAFLKRISERAAARKQFEGARIGGKDLLKWLDEKLALGGNAAGIKSVLNLKDGDIKQVGGVEADFASFSDEYLLRYVDAVLSRVAKQRRKEN